VFHSSNVIRPSPPVRVGLRNRTKARRYECYVYLAMPTVCVHLHKDVGMYFAQDFGQLLLGDVLIVASKFLCQAKEDERGFIPQALPLLLEARFRELGSRLQPGLALSCQPRKNPTSDRAREGPPPSMASVKASAAASLSRFLVSVCNRLRNQETPDVPFAACVCVKKVFHSSRSTSPARIERGALKGKGPLREWNGPSSTPTPELYLS
jgi:hypothetical protein